MNSSAEIGGVRPPDSQVAREAFELVRQVHEVPLAHHVHRTWWFAEAIGRKRNLKFDREVVYVSALLHDLGVSPQHMGPARFEVDGADAAVAFLRAHQYPEDKGALVWDAIALHTSLGIADRKQPEVALVHFGAFADVLGMGLTELAPSFVAEVLETYPRVGFKLAIQQAFAAVVARKPHTAMALKGLSDIGTKHVHNFSCPNLCDLIDAAPFDS